MSQTAAGISPVNPNQLMSLHVPTAAPGSDHLFTLPTASINPERLAIVKLGDEKFSVDRSQIPDPPAKHFSNDLAGLFEQWHCSNSLVVNGRGIPIKYWPEFYQAKKGFKSGAWKAIRVEWGNWKVSCTVAVCLHLYLIEWLIETLVLS